MGGGDGRGGEESRGGEGKGWKEGRSGRRGGGSGTGEEMEWTVNHSPMHQRTPCEC